MRHYKGKRRYKKFNKKRKNRFKKMAKSQMTPGRYF